MADLKHVYTIIEREGQEKSRWVHIGVAFVNRDQSLNIRLNALPVNGMMHVREASSNGHEGRTEEVETAAE